MIAEAETREAGGAAGARFGSISAAEVTEQVRKLDDALADLKAAERKVRELSKYGVDGVAIDGVQMFDKAVEKVRKYTDNIQFGIFRAQRRLRIVEK